jgi:diadenosine tetraphosphate (Ap4A) HIT family hydrolase
MSLSIEQRVELARRGELPYLVCRVTSGWVVLSDRQVLRGYCLLLADPVVPRLNDLEIERRSLFLREMSLVGDALLEVTGAARINYEILGNLDPGLHAHIIPRFADEPDHLRSRPVWFYDFQAAPEFDRLSDAGLVNRIREAIEKRAEISR